MFSSARVLVAAGAAVFALAAAAPAAQAAPAEVRHVYDIWFSSGVSYITDERSESGGVTRRTAAKFVASGWFRDVMFLNGTATTQRPAAGMRLSRSVGELHYVNAELDPVDTADCRDEAPRVVVPGMLNPLSAFDPKAAPTALGYAPFSAVSFDLNCDVGGTLLGIGAVSHSPGDLGPGHLRTVVVVPREKVGDQEFTLTHESVNRSIRRCPGEFVESDLRSCETVLRGNMTFIRVGGSPPPEPDDELLAPPRPERPTVDRGARRGRARARCPRGCKYRIKIFEQPRNGRGVLGRGLLARAAAPSQPSVPRGAPLVASRSGRLPAGTATRTISVTIPASKRARLIRTGFAWVTVELDPPRGRTVRRTFAVPVLR